MTSRSAPSVLQKSPRLPRPWARRLALVMALAMPLCFGSSGCGKEPPPPPQKAAQLEPLPRPAGLIADVFIPNPDAAWGKARAAVGGPALFLPGTTGGLASTMLGLPMGIGGEIDGAVPVVGAIVEDAAGGEPHAALAIHVRAGDRFIEQLTKGEQARFVSRVDEKTTMTLLEPKGGGQRAMMLGVLGNYLVVGQTLWDLTEVGPYVARTLPGAKMPKDDIAFELPQEALAGPIAKGLRTSWDKLKPRESPAGSSTLPSPIGGVVEALIAILGDLEHARVAVNLDDKAARVRLVGTPKAGVSAKAVEAMTVGDPKRMLELPPDTEVALYLRDSAAVRANDARNYAAAIARALGKETPPEDQAAVESALVAVAEGRGDSFTAGLSLLPTGPAAYVHSEVADGDKLGKALEDLVALVKRPSVKSYLEKSDVDVSTGKVVLEGMAADVKRVRLSSATDEKGKADKTKADKTKAEKDKKAAPAGEATPSTIDVLYTLGKDGLWLAAGYDAKGALGAVMNAPGKENLSGRAEVKAAVEAAGDRTSFVIVVDPLRLLARQAGKAELGPSAPILFAVGKGGEGVGEGEPWMRLDVANLALQEAMKRRGAL